MIARKFYTVLGELSDRVTLTFLRKARKKIPNIDLTEDMLGRIRFAQISSISSITIPVTAIAMINAVTLTVLDAFLHGAPRTAPVIWSCIAVLFGLMTILANRKSIRLGKSHASVRASGAVVTHTILLASLWSFPPLYFLIDATPVHVGFISSVTAGMVAGGALALYPVPLAAVLFSTWVIVVGLGSLIYHGNALGAAYAFVSATFMILVYQAIAKHAMLFLGEFLRKEEAAAQRDVITLLMGDYEQASSAWLWSCDAGLRMRNIAPGMLASMQLPGMNVDRMPLRGLLGRAGASPIKDSDAAMLSRLTGPPDGVPTQFDITLRIQTGTPHERIFSVFVRKSISESGMLVGYEGFSRDITTEYHAKQNAKFLATHDVMTGLLNAPTFHEKAQKSMQKFNAKTSKRCVVFIFIDADNLKSVNDTHGHAAGDVLIQTVATRLSAIVGDNGLVTRKGGDEFLACIFDVEQNDVEDLADTILGAICRDFAFESAQLDLSCSMGVARADSGNADLETLEKEADRALYFAKNKGRARLEHYNPTLGRELFEQRRIANDLPAAIRAREVYCEFQPIVRLEDQTISGCETLMRWDHPELGAITPEQIVTAARYSHLIAPLSALVISQALEAMKEWPAHVMVTVNVMAHELTEADFYKTILRMIEQHGAEPKRFCVEITESELLENSDQVIRNLTRLRAAGVLIAVDDFGAGYSSLNYLPQYPSDTLKIDRSLVVNSSQHHAGPLILNAVASMAKALNIPAIAEGVETEEELENVRKAGLPYVQGYYFYRPMRQAELLAVFAREAELNRPPDAANA
ncbi:MAG: diguanylate cyclase (GGDEF)-like protein [Halocynthiibacter sp.]|jgi:diguanylate cyclase (GGDEF)-like protein